jgi:primosomal protein N' (replication factor Y)
MVAIRCATGSNCGFKPLPVSARLLFADVVVPNTPLAELTYSFDPEEIGVVRAGDLVSVPLRKKMVTGVVFRVQSECEFLEQPVQAVNRVLAGQLLGEELLKLVRWAADYYLCPLGEALKLVIPSFVSVKSGAIITDSASIIASACDYSQIASGADRENLFSENRYRVWVSGVRQHLNELLISFINRRLGSGSVIVLIPESGLDEYLPLLHQQFGAAVVEYHHRLNRKQQLSAWRSIVAEPGRVIAGMRAAIWLPVKRLGGAVVINESSPSFKEERMPRYHAREVALARARFASCPVLLAGAPPAVETWWQIRNRRFSLLDRVNFPVVRRNVFVVDMRLHRGELISPRLERDLKNLSERQSAVCYINRKGLSRYVLCADCGMVLRCPNCQLPLMLSADGMVSCRLCNYQAAAPERCAGCQGANFSYRSPGVDMVVRELMRLGIRATKITGSVPVSNSGVESGYAPVQAGTRVLLRPDRNPAPALVALINFDTEFTLPDFRSRERAFALLVSILSSPPDRLVIQTCRPDDPVLDYALRGDVAGFLNWELRMRAEAGFPPWRRLVAITCAGEAAAVESGLTSFTRQLAADGRVEILGPVKLLHSRQGKPQFRVILKLPRDVLPAKILSQQLLKSLPGRVRIDVDPLEIV